MSRSPVRQPLFRSACACIVGLTFVGCQTGEKPTSRAEMQTMMAEGKTKAAGTPTVQMQGVLDEFAKLGPKPIETLSAADARRQPSMTDAAVAVLKKKNLPVVPIDGVTIENRMIPGAEGDVAARVYTPANVAANAPLIVYYRGGGWVIATLDTYEPSCRALAAMTGAKVISVNYRQAPEHPFPAAHEDAYAALQWAFANAASIGCDPAKVAVVGESAGGNLASAVCLMARDRGGMMPVASVMIYPVASTRPGTLSQMTYTDTKLPLHTQMLPWFLRYYAPTAEDKASPYLDIADDTGSLAKFPPATVIVADIDPLHSEGEAYAAKLKAAKVDAVYMNYKGVTHEFFGMGAIVDEAKAAEKLASDRLKAAFATKKM